MRRQVADRPIATAASDTEEIWNALMILTRGGDTKPTDASEPCNAARDDQRTCARRELVPEIYDAHAIRCEGRSMVDDDEAPVIPPDRVRPISVSGPASPQAGETVPPERRDGAASEAETTDVGNSASPLAEAAEVAADPTEEATSATSGAS